MRNLLALAVLTSLGLAAQEPPPPPARPDAPRGGGMMRPYDATKEATFKGTVAEVKENTRGERTMVTLVVTIEGKDVPVNLGPDTLLKEKKITFAKGDAVTILGVKMETPRGEMIVPREITKGKETLTLRDKEGKPTWAPPAR